MSNPDIPLHTLSRSRARYAPLIDQDTANPHQADQTDMHTAALRTAAAARTTTRGFGSARSSKGKGKQRERYTDESDEEAALLLGHVERDANGDPDGDEDGDIGGEGQSSTRLKRLEGSQVSRVRSFVLRGGRWCSYWGF